MHVGYELGPYLLMEFHHLRAFVTTVEQRSVTAAAKKLFISQPALSRQIRTLEDELGVPLFRREKKRLHLTEAGRFFLDRARQILCDAETVVQQLRERCGDAKRTLRVGLLTVFLDDLVSPALLELQEQAPHLSVALFELSPQAQIARLEKGEIDLALLGNLLPRDRTRFVVRSLARSPMAAVLPRDHALAHRKRIDLKELAGDSFVSLSEDFFPDRRRFLRDICQSRGFEPRIVEESHSLTLMLASVSRNTGVGVLPVHSAKLPHAGCVFVPLHAPRVYAEVMAVYKTEAEQVLAPLLEQLTQAAKSALEGKGEK